MRRRVKIMLKLWFKRLIFTVLLILIVWVNYLRLQDNNYSNYEKVIDFGRIKDNDKLIKPVITAIFYDGKNRRNHLFLPISTTVKTTKRLILK